jgi:hypothetical protein
METPAGPKLAAHGLQLLQALVTTAHWTYDAAAIAGDTSLA